MRQLTLLEELEWKIESTPWRCNDQDLQILVDYARDLLKDRDYQREQCFESVNKRTEDNKALVGKLLVDMLNKAEQQL